MCSSKRTRADAGMISAEGPGLETKRSNPSLPEASGRRTLVHQPAQSGPWLVNHPCRQALAF